MATSGNPNPLGGGGHFDLQNLYRPSAPPQPLTSSNPNPQNFMVNVSNPSDFASAHFPPTSGGAGGGGGVYPFPPQAAGFNYHPVYTAYSNTLTPQHHPDFAPPQRSMSYPTPTLQPQVQTGVSPLHANFQTPAVHPNNHGARLMALLSAPPTALDIPQQHIMPMPSGSSSVSDSSQPLNVDSMPSGLVGSPQNLPLRMPSNKIPKGRHLIGDRLVYDIDVRLPGEAQPQLEVTPITKYGSDPGLVLGRQIAISNKYICYGLKLGAIRVLNTTTALRSLLKGLNKRVTDMAFFAEDVDILASASVDGRVYVWKITEGPDEEDKPQISGWTVIALQVTGEAENAHPRVCWHCHKQEVLVVGIGRHILKIDTTKVGKGEKFSSEEPLNCPIDKLIDGVQLVGTHDGEVTGLSMCQWMTTRLVSGSIDGTIKIWEDRRPQPIAVLRPHDGHPVNSVTFLAAPPRPDHIILITGGPMNCELKIWVPGSEKGWLLSSDAESWRCIQTLELKTSEARAEEAFFNQVMALPQASLLLLVNAKRNAIYAVHLDYGLCPAESRMDYIAEFTVTMPILSFTGTSQVLPHDEQKVRLYCVQTQAIQYYVLDLSHCLPPPSENVYGRFDSNANPDASSPKAFVDVEAFSSIPTEISISSLPPKSAISESVVESSPAINLSTSLASSHLTGAQEFLSVVETNLLDGLRTSENALSSLGIRGSEGPSLSENISEPKIVEYSVDRQMDVICKSISDAASVDSVPRSDDSRHSQDDSIALGQQAKFKHPTHLVTPAEILMANSASELSKTSELRNDPELNIQDVGISNDARSVEVEVKVVDEAGIQHEHHTSVLDNKEKSFSSQSLGNEMSQACELIPEAYVVHEAHEPSVVEEARGASDDVSREFVDSPEPTIAQPSSNQKRKKQRGKNLQASVSASQTPNAFNSTDSFNEPLLGSSTTMETAFAQLLSMQEMLNQVVTLQKDMQKQLGALVADPVTKEGKRLEASIKASVEDAFKTHADDLSRRFHDENLRQEWELKDHVQQLSNVISNCLNKEMPALIDKAIKKELSSVGQSLARTITHAIEKTVSSSIVENFQKGVGDKAVNQLEKSVSTKLEATVARHIQTQFQTSGKQALQESMKSSFEALVIPAFGMSCRTMLEQLDSTLQKGIMEHTTAAQHQLESAHSPLAIALRDAINSASSMTQTLGSEVLEGQRKLLALAVSGANSKAVTTTLLGQLNNGPLGAIHDKLEVPVDPTKELFRLIGEWKYEEAFTSALQRSDVSIVSWLCSQVDLAGILSMSPLPLSQGVLLSLVQQLACDINNDTPRKLTWMREVLSAVNPVDPMIVMHVRPIFEQVYQILNHQRSLPTMVGSELSNIRLIMHVINSMLMASK